MGGSMDVIKGTLADFPRDAAYVVTAGAHFVEPDGEQELSLEVWEGGYGLTIKEAVIDEVTLIKR